MRPIIAIGDEIDKFSTSKMFTNVSWFNLDAQR